MTLPTGAVPVTVDARSPDDADRAIAAVVRCHVARLQLWGDPPFTAVEDVELVTFVLAGAPPLTGLPGWLVLEGLHSVGAVRLREVKELIGYVRFHDMPPGWS